MSAVATSTNDVTWSWGTPPHVCLSPGSASVLYQLIDAPSGAILTPPGDMVYATTSITESLTGSSNQLVYRKLKLTDTWGSGLSAATSIYTLANPPLANSVVPSVVTVSSALINWDQNGNPAYTRYLLSYSQDATFATGVSTPTTLASDFTGSSVALPGLAAGTTYFARVQAFSGRFRRRVRRDRNRVHQHLVYDVARRSRPWRRAHRQRLDHLELDLRAGRAVLQSL